MTTGNKPIQYYQYLPGEWDLKAGEVITETPVSLTVNGEVWLTFMCTPVDLEAMAVGFLFNEGLIDSIEEVAQVHLCQAGDNVDVWTCHALEKPENWRRTSGCTGGITSVEYHLDDEVSEDEKIYNGALLTPEKICNLLSQLFESQSLYRQSGGVHTSAISDGEKIRLAAEDIGRHNTLDKLAGRLLQEKLDLKHRIILTTGRISSEMLQKADRMGATFIISRTSPSSLSIQLARQKGITLVGYTRRDRFNVYAHSERIMLDPIKLQNQIQSNEDSIEAAHDKQNSIQTNQH